MPNKDPQGPTSAAWAVNCVLALLAMIALISTIKLSGSFHDEPVPHTTLRTPAIREAAALEQELLTIEAKMHLSLSWTLHQTELARRHAQVSAIACSSAADHAQDTLRLAQKAMRRSIRQEARANAKQALPDNEGAETPAVPAQTAARNGHRSG